jgi:hypothetical protein
MSDWPKTLLNGTTVWACCVSSIGPTCKHQEAPVPPQAEHARNEQGSAAEYLIANVLLVASVLVLAWGPLVYVLRTVEFYQGVAA